MAARADIARWMQRRNRDASVYTRRGEGSPDVTLVVVVVLADSGHRAPIGSRLRRKGGQLTDIPAELERELIEATVQAMPEAS
jgi:hypothetical protein